MLQQDIFSWGLPVGRVAGIPVRIHWLLLLFWVVELQDTLRSIDADRRVVIMLWLAQVGLLFGSILLHELGHAFVARAVGGAAFEILLWPLGGLAFCQAPHRWREQLAVAAGGPLVTLGIVGVSALAFHFGGDYLSSLESLPAVALASVAEQVLLEWNGYILVFNLIPLYPLDGGRIFHACVWGFFEWRGAWGAHGRAVGLTLWVTRATAAAGIAYGIWQKNGMLIVIMFWAWLSAEQLRR
jgi:Zn-dependent protease